MGVIRLNAISDFYASPAEFGDWVRDWVREHKPDIAVVIFNDHGNSFFLDKVPTFAVGCAEEYRPVDEGWGPRPIPPFMRQSGMNWSARIHTLN